MRTARVDWLAMMLDFAVLVCIVLLVTGCASTMASPDVKADSIKDGTAVCATVMGAWGSGKTVVVKLDQGVIRDGGSVTVDGNCVMSVILTPPLPKPAPAPKGP